MALYKTDPTKILFLDIETVSQQKSFDLLSDLWKDLWDSKTKFQRGEEESPEEYYPKRAAVMAEFGKVICISCGYLKEENSILKFHLKSFYGHNEKKVLEDFAEMLRNHFDNRFLLCAHNGKEFDFPFMARRMLVHGIELPVSLNTSGSKPWEIPHLDTMEMWKFGDWKNYTSVKLLSALFGIPTPKDDIDGSMVGDVYWQDDDLERIVKYCEKDTVTVARIFLKMEGRGELTDGQILWNENE